MVLTGIAGTKNNIKGSIYMNIKATDELTEVFNSGAADRFNTAKHTDSLEILEILAYDPDVQIRRAVAYNKNTPESLLIDLAEDNDADIQMYVAANPNTPSEVLSKIITTDNSKALRAATVNPNITSELLGILSSNDDTRVRSAVAANEKTPVEVLKKMAKDKDAVVRYYATNTLHMLQDKKKEARRIPFWRR